MSEIQAAEDFFLPSTSGPIDFLIEDYKNEVETAEKVVSFVKGGDMVSSISHFADGWNKLEHHRLYQSLSGMFEMKYAIASLNAKYWTKALNLTDVMDYMPSKARDEWNEQIRTLQTPDFDKDTVKATIHTLMGKRMDFLAEMVDGIFTGLSGEHVTNRPEGFGKRMIIDNVYSYYSSGRKEGLIHDMRCVIAKFMGNENPKYELTRRMLERIRCNTGEWHNVDGNAFRIRVYKKGTAHLEVNQEIAYRLNQILAYLHPMAIPAPHRKKPNKKPMKDFKLIKNTIPFAVIDLLVYGRFSDKVGENTFTMSGGKSKYDKHLAKQTSTVLEAIGGVEVESGQFNWKFKFDYNAKDVINEVIHSGVIPDSVSHQYYPTPEVIAEAVAKIADVQESDYVLEPSAGQGDLLKFITIGKGMETLIEADKLHCEVLRSKGYENVIWGDFLKAPGGKADKIIMNPPYSQGRWQAHFEHAAGMLANGGKLVAVLPASCNGKLSLPGKEIKYHGIYSNEFKGTSISVVIVEVEHGN